MKITLTVLALAGLLGMAAGSARIVREDNARVELELAVTETVQEANTTDPSEAEKAASEAVTDTDATTVTESTEASESEAEAVCDADMDGITVIPDIGDDDSQWTRNY